MRYVQITSNVLTHPRGAVVSQDRLHMTDDKLDEFIAAGYAIECDVIEDPAAKAKTKRPRAKS